MKKLIIILLLLSSMSYSQTVLQKYQLKEKYYVDVLLQEKILSYSVKRIYYEKIKIDDILDTNRAIYEGNRNLGGQANKDTNEIRQELLQVQKEYQNIYQQKVKALETTDTDLLRIQGIILYLNQKLETERKKK